MNSGIFISYLNTLKREHLRFVPFYDGVLWHTSGTVKKFLEKNRKTIMQVSFGRTRKSISNYFSRKKIKLNIINYLDP